MPGDSGEEVSEESEEDGGKEDDWGMIKPRVRKALRGRVRCNDGFAMSVQESREHTCTPRDDTGPYPMVERGGVPQRGGTTTNVTLRYTKHGQRLHDTVSST